jgi:hypothetical protein
LTKVKETGTIKFRHSCVLTDFPQPCRPGANCHCKEDGEY